MNATLSLVLIIAGVILIGALAIRKFKRNSSGDSSNNMCPYDNHLGEMTTTDIPKSLIKKEKEYAKRKLRLRKEHLLNLRKNK